MHLFNFQAKEVIETNVVKVIKSEYGYEEYNIVSEAMDFVHKEVCNVEGN